jgi:hypothetical protein
MTARHDEYVFILFRPPRGLCLLLYEYPIHVRLARQEAGEPAHHGAVGVGHIAGKIEMLDRLLGLETTCIC